jgi:hypothetical protein
MLYELIYRSLSCQEKDRESLDSLLTLSRWKNEQVGITGMLLYHGQEFLQILEGDQASVKNLYKRIEGDKRHHGAHVVWEGEIDERGFDAWTMGFIDARSQSLGLPAGYSNFLKDGKLSCANDTPTLCKQILVHLRDTLLIAPTIPTAI